MQDFGYETIKAIEFSDWWENSKRYDYELITDFCFKSSKYGAPEATYFNYLKRDSIPVGSVEFVLEFMKQCYNIKNVKPLNIPEQLINYTNRDIQYLNKSVFLKNLDANKKYFIKSATKIKGYTEQFEMSNIDDIPDDDYMVSEIINIESEWRCFVKDEKLLDIRCYSGNPFAIPSSVVISDMIKDYISSPPAYTLDVCVGTDGKTSIIECHNFFGCGLYGFSDYKNYLIMLIRAFRWQVENNK